jgi:hypothetical protein
MEYCDHESKPADVEGPAKTAPAATTGAHPAPPIDEERPLETGDSIPGSRTLHAAVEVPVGDGEVFEIVFSIDNNPRAQPSDDVMLAFRTVEAKNPRVIGALMWGRVFLAPRPMDVTDFSDYMCREHPHLMITRYILPGQENEDGSYGPPYYFAWHGMNGNCEMLRRDRADVVVRCHVNQFGGRMIPELIYSVCNGAIAVYDQHESGSADGGDGADTYSTGQ